MSLAAEILLKGQKVVLKHNMTDPHEAERIIALAAAKIREAETRAPQAASHQIALLALVDLASEYLMAKDRTLAYQQKIQDKSQALSELLNPQVDPQTVAQGENRSDGPAAHA